MCLSVIENIVIYNVKKGNNKKIDTENKEKKNAHLYHELELNSLSYQKAIKYDKRTFFQYYCCLLKQKHLIMFTFISRNDYNLFINKLSLFIFSISLYFTVNTLFFTDSTIHKIYEEQSKVQLIYSLMNIFYSTVITSAITITLKMLALSNKNILKLKTYKKREKVIKESNNLIKEYNLKFSIFYLVSFVFMLAFWYFISAFCAVYKNSQLYLIENTLSSFTLSLIYPLGLNLLPGMFRITALRAKNKKCMYTFGNFISIF